MKKQISLQWKLTAITAVLVVVVCLILSFAISRSALVYMGKIENSVIAIFPKETINYTEPVSDDIALNITDNISDQIHNTQTAFWIKSLIVTAIIALISSTLVYFILGYALRPLRQLASQVEYIQIKNMQIPADIKKSSKEITQLVEAFNGMLSRLSDAFFIQRQFSANAAHELRTPLALMQTKLDVLKKQKNISIEDYSETIDMLSTQTERLSHVISMLLEMTELHTIKLDENIVLNDIVEEVLCDIAPLAEKKQIALLQENTSNISITGSDTLIYRAIFNLVENAIKNNISSGNVTVKLSQENDYAKILVSDTGCGIPEEYWQRIFEPFYRVDKSRSRAMGGAGLGLALVSEIATRHGGDVRVLASSKNGSDIELRLHK